MNIVAVTTPKQTKQFIDFPHTLYAGDPIYVPEIYIGQKEMFDRKKNPFFNHAKVSSFLAMEGTKIVGRISAIRNDNYNKYVNANVGFFGFFDVIENYEIAKALLDKAVEWIKAVNLDAILGPTNFSTNETAGVLVEGFDDPPSVMMTYNKPYYAGFLDRYGFKKQKDLLAYVVTKDTISMKSVKLAGMIEERLKRKGITCRKANMKNFKEEIRNVREVYQAAWDKNWGFVPPTTAEFDHLADGLKMILDPDFAIVAEQDGKMIGFALAIPDINQIMRTVKKGRLFPTGLFKLLYYKGKVDKIRIILLGVLPEYRRMGIEGVFYAQIISNGIRRGITTAEASWILEDNEMMNKGLQNINAEVYKRYRIYEKNVS